jgi:predicted O-linked N-acetylglucosamine transferase (SPINDLY family)
LQAGLFLDTNPYNAHTTASDALFVGCPVLTRPGDTFASRVAASLNRTVGRTDVDSDEAYSPAIELARQPARLDALRARLRDPSARARLFDIQAYANDFAALLTTIAARARGGQPPQDIWL